MRRNAPHRNRTVPRGSRRSGRRSLPAIFAQMDQYRRHGQRARPDRAMIDCAHQRGSVSGHMGATQIPTTDRQASRRRVVQVPSQPTQQQDWVPSAPIGSRRGNNSSHKQTTHRPWAAIRRRRRSQPVSDQLRSIADLCNSLGDDTGVANVAYVASRPAVEFVELIPNLAPGEYLLRVLGADDPNYLASGVDRDGIDLSLDRHAQLL